MCVCVSCDEEGELVRKRQPSSPSHGLEGDKSSWGNQHKSESLCVGLCLLNLCHMSHALCACVHFCVALTYEPQHTNSHNMNHPLILERFQWNAPSHYWGIAVDLAIEKLAGYWRNPNHPTQPSFLSHLETTSKTSRCPKSNSCAKGERQLFSICAVTHP